MHIFPAHLTFQNIIIEKVARLVEKIKLIDVSDSINLPSSNEPDSLERDVEG